MNNRKKTETRRESLRILAKGHARSENTRKTHINNNLLGVGNPGTGKTTSIVIPNLFTSEGSVVVVDVKCRLYKDYAEMMKQRGYRVELLDFVNPEHSGSYNMMDSIIRYKKKRETVFPGEYDEDGNKLQDEEVYEWEVDAYRQMDVQKLVASLIPDSECRDDHFWISSSRMVLESLMAYVLEVLPAEKQNMGSVCRLFDILSEEMMEKNTVGFLDDLEKTDPDSFAVRRYRMFRSCSMSEKTWSCINEFVANALSIFMPEENADLLCSSGIDLADCGREKIALFVNVSDVDRSMDIAVNTFYIQLIQQLVREADSRPDGRLQVPCHIILDDFACNVFVPDFDRIISGTRSRDISFTVILQSISQLQAMYNPGQASTIINACDTVLFLGGSDPDTGRFFADRAGILPESILNLDNDFMWIFTRGEKPVLAEKIRSYELNLAEEGFWK